MYIQLIGLLQARISFSYLQPSSSVLLTFGLLKTAAPPHEK